MGKRGPKKGTKYKKKENKNEYVAPIEIESIPSSSESLKNSEPLEFNPLEIFNEAPKQEAPKPEPEPENLKEEAAGVLAGVFELGALATGIPEFSLSIEEKLAATPSFIPIYKKYIKEALGEHTELVVFAFVMSGVIGKRVPMVIKKYGNKNTKHPEAR